MASFTFEEIWSNFNIDAGLGLFTEKAAIPGPGFDDSWVPGEDLTVTSVLSTDQPFEFAIQWRQTGNLCNNLDANHKWRIELLFEQMGKSEWELPFAYRVTEEPYVRAEPHNYSVTISVPQRTVPVGVYRITAVLTLTGPESWRRNPVVGFSEIKPLVQWYED